MTIFAVVNSDYMKNLSQLGAVPVDYAVLESFLSDYSAPRHKIASLEKQGQILRLKRGLYVLSPEVSGELLQRELIANHIYGPSYVSMESALRYYGLIPESVYAVKSMTTKRSRSFENTIGRFDYTICEPNYYSIGINLESNDKCSYLMASPEKALCDLIAYTPKLRPRFVKSLRVFLEEDLRLNMEQFYKMDVEIVRECAENGRKKNEINNLLKLL